METKKNPNKQLPPQRSLFLSTGLCLSLLITFSAFQIRKTPSVIIPHDVPEFEFPVMVEIEPTQFKTPQPPKPKVTVPVLISVDAEPDLIEFEEPKVTIDIDVENFMVDFIEPPVEIAQEPTEVLIPEQAASFPGGIQEWQAYLRKNLRYPRQAQRLGREGKVLLSFNVDASGNISDIKVVRGIGGGCDREAIRVLQNSPQWSPGLQRGVPVKSPMSIFIRFRLK